MVDDTPTPPPPPLSSSPSHFWWVSTPTVAVLFAVSIVGSISIFFLVCLSKTFRRTSNYLVANLCVASTYHIVVSILYNLQTGGVELWGYGATSCYVTGFVNRLSTPVLPLTIAFISLDRSTVARNPLDYPSKGSTIARLAFIWIFSGVLLIPRASMSVFDGGVVGVFKCRKVLLWDSVTLHTSYAVITLLVIYIAPSYILVKEFFVMRNQMKFLTVSQVEHKKRFHVRVRVMQNACIFTCIFITCWLPQGISQFPFDLPEGHFLTPGSLEGLVGVRNFFRQLSICNTCLNPIILLVLSFDIREYVAAKCCSV